MADKTIGQLVAATNVTPTDLFVLEQSGTAKKLTGQILENWLVSFADGHGGIQSITKTGTSGLVDTYTITLADTTTVTFTVTNGKAISSVTTYYAVSSDGSTAPSSWSTTRQIMTSTNRYLWSYQTIAFNDNSTIDTVKTVIGVWGDKGDTGAAGRGIEDLEQTSRVPGSYTLYTFTMSDGTTETFYSYDGVGISGIEKTSTSGLVDTYTISYTNNTTTTFTVTNAKSIVSITKTSTVGLVDTYTILFNDETSTMFTVSNGKSISSISKTSTSGLVDTYTISMNDGTTTTFTVTNGSSISTIAKTSTVGLVDTYTVTLTDGTTTTFTVTNAKSIVSVTMVSGTHAAGTTDTYRITFNDGDTTDFTVYNGTNGTGSVSTVDGISSTNQNVTLLLTGNGPPTESTVGQLKQRYFDLSNQILYICVGIDTSSNPATYSWAGTGVPVDSSLSSTSENPVQNKVITGKVGTSALTTTATDLSGAVNELNSLKATLASPALTGTPTAPTASASTDNTQIATTAFANRAANNAVSTFVRPNLLDNWYFVGGGSQLGYGVFPINQRGQTSYIGGAVYVIDRWQSARNQITTIENDCITFTESSINGFGAYQKLATLPAGTYTLSILVKSSTVNLRFALRNYTTWGTYGTRIDISPSNSKILGKVTFTLNSPATTPCVYLEQNGTVATGDTYSIIAVKLELGSEQTLAHQENGAWVLNEIPDYETELLRCKASTADPSDPYANGSVEFGNNIGIVQNTNTATQNISEGQYVIWHGALYTASAAIASGAALSSSNLTVVTGGGLNNLLALFYQTLNNNAGAHNGIYRGRYLGSSVTAEQWSAISAGTFDDLYIGDYWTINSVNWRIAAFDYWLRTGDTECTAHHVVIVPDTALYNAKMNDSDVTTGAYVGSKMYTTNLATAKTTINNAFGSAHILNHRENLQNAVTNGYESAGTWYDSTVDLMNEKMVYGCDIFHSMSHGANWANHYTIDKCQLPLFALDPSKITIRAPWWLRGVASSTHFCSVTGSGLANADTASISRGVRPAFGIKA